MKVFLEKLKSEVDHIIKLYFSFQVHRFLKFNFDSGQLSSSLQNMPLAEIFVLVGFYLIYAIEELTHLMIDRCAAGHLTGIVKNNIF